ncbi:hypothetical protein YC2023_053114 [Brassica napus]
MGLSEYKIIDIDSNLFLGPNPYKREVHIVIISLQPHNFRVHEFYDYQLLSTNNGGSEIACDLTICQQSSRRTHDVQPWTSGNLWAHGQQVVPDWHFNPSAAVLSSEGTFFVVISIQRM